MPEQDVDGGELREGVLWRAVIDAGREYGSHHYRRKVHRHFPHFVAALDNYAAYIAAKAKVEALREQPCRSLKVGDCLTLAVEHPSLGGEHDMCRRCTPLADAEAAFATLQREGEAG